jgi:hypothetical protein
MSPEDALREKIREVTAGFEALEQRCRRTGRPLEGRSVRDIEDLEND